MNLIKKLFGPKINKQEQYTAILEKSEESLVAIDPPRQMAPIIPLIDNQLEYKDLAKNHADFFIDKNDPIERLQSQITTSTNIADVNPSRSEVFFKNAPEVKDFPDFIENTEEILAIESYNHIPILDEELEEDKIEMEEEVNSLQLANLAYKNS